MPQATGAQAVFALYDESTYKTDPGTPDGLKAYVTGNQIQKTQNQIDSEVLTGGRGFPEPMLGKAKSSGAFPTELAPESIGFLLRHLMGNVVTTGAGPYVHTLTIGNLPTSFIVETDHGPNIAGSGRYARHNGCRIASANFDFPEEGPCGVTFNVVGAKTTLSATPLDATLTDNGHRSFSAFEGAIEEGGSASAQIRSASLTVDNDIDEDSYVYGSNGEIIALPEGRCKVSGSLVAIFEDAALMNKALNSTETDLKITLSRGDGLGSAGNESLETLIQQMKYTPKTPAISGPRGVTIELDYFGYLSGADLGLQFTLKNALSSI